MTKEEARVLDANYLLNKKKRDDELAEQVGRILMMTKDPTVHFPDRDSVPAITTLLHRVCGNDLTKFEEATRLIELFIVAALKDGET